MKNIIFNDLAVKTQTHRLQQYYDHTAQIQGNSSKRNAYHAQYAHWMSSTVRRKYKFIGQYKHSLINTPKHSVLLMRSLSFNEAALIKGVEGLPVPFIKTIRSPTKILTHKPSRTNTFRKQIIIKPKNNKIEKIKLEPVVVFDISPW